MRAEVRLVGDLSDAVACSFAEVALGLGLQLPGDTSDQELFVKNLGPLPEHFPVLSLENCDRQTGQLLNRLA
jgi:hypothetical protein